VGGGLWCGRQGRLATGGSKEERRDRHERDEIEKGERRDKVEERFKIKK
jgi:hypothetical protein